MNANCSAFERWLDEGRPAAGSAAHEAHAAGCARCASLLELEEALAAPRHSTAPADFTDAVMRRVHASPAGARRRAHLFPTPIWVHALMDPIVALTLTAILLTWLGRGALFAAASALGTRLAAVRWPVPHWPAFSLPEGSAILWPTHLFASLSGDPVLLTGLLLALAPAVLLGSWQIFRWTDHWVAGAWDVPAARRAGANAVAR